MLLFSGCSLKFQKEQQNYLNPDEDLVTIEDNNINSGSGSSENNPDISDDNSYGPMDEDSETGNNSFNLSGVKVGDKMGNMTINSIEPALDSFSLGDYNVKIQFSGRAVITGDYKYETNSGFGGIERLCFMNFDDNSVKLIPTLHTDQRDLYLCFTNSYDSGLSLAKEKLNLLTDDRGRAIIIIDNYRLVSAETEVFNTAKFIDLEN
ncbi:MAG TPA: hypothetical protein PK896_00760 [bacterium]|nr:hypothetical protein [bacterium]